jgi:choline dehydrogenase-like flavoprotein
MPAWIELYDDKGNGHLSVLSEVSKKRDHSNKNMAYTLSTRIEQAPNPNSRISLDTEKDALGVPRAQLHWELSNLEKKSMRTFYHVLGKQIGQAGLGRIKLYEFLRDEKDETWPATTGGGWHHMGTTRMSNDPKLGVTDAHCQVHGIDNFYLAGSSNFVTAGAPNPTLTLVALTLRLSDHMKQKIKKTS